MFPTRQHLDAADPLAASVRGLDGVLPRTVARVVVTGAGTMKSGIAVTLADAGLTMDLLEQDAGGAAAGLESVRDLYLARVKRGRVAVRAASSSALGTALEWIGFPACGAVSAAVLPALFFPSARTLGPNGPLEAHHA